jgi:hypothetical protein
MPNFMVGKFAFAGEPGQVSYWMKNRQRRSFILPAGQERPLTLVARPSAEHGSRAVMFP